MEMTFNFGFRDARNLCIMACAAMLLTLAGCGGKEGPPRFDLSGTVTCDGKPVPLGFIQFSPDTAKGNTGPGTSVDIRDGRYKTMVRLGTVGGPHTVEIYGFDGKPTQSQPMGKPLFPVYKASVEFAKQPGGVHDFAIPSEK